MCAKGRLTHTMDHLTSPTAPGSILTPTTRVMSSSSLSSHRGVGDIQSRHGVTSTAAASLVHTTPSTATCPAVNDVRSQHHPAVVSSSLPPPTEPNSRSSISTVDSEGRVGASSLRRMSKRWTTLETAGRFMFVLSVAFLVIGVVLTAVGFATGGTTGSGTVSTGTLAMQIGGPVCLATTAVMWALGVAFSRLWRTEWRRRQQAMELRARVQLHALAMDLLKKPILSPRVLQDPVLRRQLLVKLRQQSAMDVRSVYQSTPMFVSLFIEVL